MGGRRGSSRVFSHGAGEGEHVGREGAVAGRQAERVARGGAAWCGGGWAARASAFGEAEEGRERDGQQPAERAQVASGLGGGRDEIGEVGAFQPGLQLGAGGGDVVAAEAEEPEFGAGHDGARAGRGGGCFLRGRGRAAGAGGARGRQAAGQKKGVEARNPLGVAPDAVGEDDIERRPFRCRAVLQRENPGEEGSQICDDVGEVVRDD